VNPAPTTPPDLAALLRRVIANPHAAVALQREHMDPNACAIGQLGPFNPSPTVLEAIYAALGEPDPFRETPDRSVSRRRRKL
jgi:hypothetical protein